MKFIFVAIALKVFEINSPHHFDSQQRTFFFCSDIMMANQFQQRNPENGNNNWCNSELKWFSKQNIYDNNFDEFDVGRQRTNWEFIWNILWSTDSKRILNIQGNECCWMLVLAWQPTQKEANMKTVFRRQWMAFIFWSSSVIDDDDTQKTIRITYVSPLKHIFAFG